GGLRLALNLPDGPLAAGFASSWKEFAAEGEASMEVDASRAEFCVGEPLWVFPLPERLRDGTLRLRGPEYSAEAGPDRRLFFTSGFAHRLAIENVFKLLLADWLLEQGGLLLHSAAVSLASRACLFVDPRGQERLPWRSCARAPGGRSWPMNWSRSVRLAGHINAAALPGTWGHPVLHASSSSASWRLRVKTGSNPFTPLTWCG